jgi:peroxiredoxin family protein
MTPHVPFNNLRRYILIHSAILGGYNVIRAIPERKKKKRKKKKSPRRKAHLIETPKDMLVSITGCRGGSRILGINA